LKAILGVISPLSPQVANEDPGLRPEFYALRDKHNGDYGAAILEFQDKHPGMNVIPYTVARTEGAVKGNTIPYTNEAIDWIESHKDLIESPNAIGALYLVPQGATDGDTQAIHDELLKMHLRERRTGKQFMEAVYAAQGNNLYYADKKIHDDYIASLSPDPYTAKFNKDKINAENDSWKNYQDTFGKMNPVWLDDHTSQVKNNNASAAYAQLQDMFSKGIAPAGPQTDLVKSLMGDYVAHSNALNNIRGNMMSGMTVTEEQDNWQAYLDDLAVKEPRLQTVINGVFRRLD
jgi:hypothetical protein